MADQLVSGAEISVFLGVGPAEGIRLAEQATSLVQEATGQRLVQVVDEQITIMGTTDSWLALPEIPVTAVSLVELNGEEITDYKLVGSRLWRACGWSSRIYEPSVVDVTCTHGYPPGHQRLERARTAVYAQAVDIHDNPSGTAGGFSIDDYREGPSVGDDGGPKLPESVARALRRYYGKKAGLVRLG